MSADESRIPGWFGKIPNLGDFASRRLPARFLVPWDDWLQRALASSRAQLGNDWLNTYLTSPLWRFLLLPGVCGRTAWAGVQMPSVDRVGRYFPLTIASETAVLPANESEWKDLSSWYSALENAAMASLDIDYSPQDLDNALCAHPFPAAFAGDDLRGLLAQKLAQRLQDMGTGTTAYALSSLNSVGPLLAATAAQMLNHGGGDKSLWWSHPKTDAPSVLICCDGLPSPGDFCQLITGSIAVTSGSALL